MDAKTIIDTWCIERTMQISGNKVFPNTYLGRHEADIFEVTKAGYLYEFEVKISRADFFADAKKVGKSDKVMSGERCNHFIYLVPQDLIKPEEVPEYAGLQYVTDIFYTPARKMGNYDDLDWMIPNLRTKIITPSPRLSHEKLGKTHLPKLMESTYTRFHTKTIWSKYPYIKTEE